jgi:hypothetical protein
MPIYNAKWIAVCDKCKNWCGFYDNKELNPYELVALIGREGWSALSGLVYCPMCSNDIIDLKVEDL